MPRGTPVKYENKIVEMEEWLRDYPEATFIAKKVDIEKYLRKYSKSDEEYQELSQKYYELKNVYTQLANRQSRTDSLDPVKLPKEIYDLCVEHGIGGIFPYPENVRQTAKKYKIKQSIANSILLRYGSIENALDLYYKDELDEYGIEIISGLIDRVIDVSSNPKSKSYEELVRRITKHFEIEPKDIIMFKSSRIEELINTLPDGQKTVIRALYGINRQKVNVREWANKRNISTQGIYELRDIAIRKLEKMMKDGSEYLTFEQIKGNTEDGTDYREKVDEFQKRLFVSGAIIKTKDSEKALSPEEIQSLKLEESYDEIIRKVKDNEKKIKQESVKNIKKFRIEWLELNEETVIALKKQGISTVAELITTDPRVIQARMTPINGKKISKSQKDEMMDEIRNALKRFDPNMHLQGEIDEEEIGPARKLTKNDFTKGTLAELAKEGITTVEDISQMTESYFGGIKNVGAGTINKTKELLATYGLSFKPEPEENKKSTRGRKSTTSLVMESFSVSTQKAAQRTLASLERLLNEQVKASKESATQEKATEDKGDIGE